MSTDRFVVESGKKVVGIAIKVPGGFKFFSSDPDYERLEATIFPRAHTLMRRVSDVGRARRALTSAIQTDALSHTRS